jgi:hypothetical protein
MQVVLLIPEKTAGDVVSPVRTFYAALVWKGKISALPVLGE